MDRLWTPWRMAYIAGGAQHDGCVLCEKASESTDRANYVLYRGEQCFTILNLYPYNNGHLMIVPYQHTGKLEEIPNETLCELMELVQRSVRLLKQTLNPAGFNIGMNIARIAGAGIDEHLHMHIVPRWNGDTNFMPVLADTRVMPEMLSTTYENLYAVIKDNPSWGKGS